MPSEGRGVTLMPLVYAPASAIAGRIVDPARARTRERAASYVVYRWGAQRVSGKAFVMRRMTWSPLEPGLTRSHVRSARSSIERIGGAESGVTSTHGSSMNGMSV